MMLKQPCISFIVTSYNYAKFIEETVISIKNQTYNNIEIIVVDDYSTDNSIEILEKINNIKLIKHDKNKGQLASILTGLKQANGDYVSFIDSDDVLFENYAEILIQKLLTTNVAFVSANSEENKVLTPKTNSFGGWWWQPMSSAMFKKSVIDILINYINTELWRICPDKFLFNFAHLIGNSELVSDKLFFKRQHENNAGISKNRFLINLKNNLIIRKELKSFILKNKEHFKNYKELIKIINQSYSHLISQVLKKIY